MTNAQMYKCTVGNEQRQKKNGFPALTRRHTTTASWGVEVG